MAKKPLRLKIKLNDSNEPNLSEPIQLCQILSIERDHDNIGSCLFNIHTSLLPNWIAFCRQSAQYQEGSCELKWEQMARSQSGSEYHLTHLRQWAKIDSPANYIDFTFEQIYQTHFKARLEKPDFNPNLMTEALNHLIHTIHQEHNYCVLIKPTTWYQFQPQNHRWEVINTGDCFKGLVTETTLKFIYCLTHTNKIQLSPTELVNLNILSKQLTDGSLIDSLVKSCLVSFYDGTFETRLNRKLHLIAYDNGVYDTETSEFRNGQPDDFISLSCNFDYQSEPEQNQTYMTPLLNYLAQLIPNPAELDQLLKSLSSQIFDQHKHLLIVDNDGRVRRGLLELLAWSLGDHMDRIRIVSLPEDKVLKLVDSSRHNIIYHSYKLPSRVDRLARVINLQFPGQVPKPQQVWAPTFLHLLIITYTQSSSHQIKSHSISEIKGETSLIDYQLFINQILIVNPNSSIGLQLTYDAFKKWFISNYSKQNLKLPTRQQMKDTLEKMIGVYLPSKKGGWKGYQFKAEIESLSI